MIPMMGVDDEANGNEDGDGKMSYGERRLEEGDDNSGDFDEEDVNTPPRPALRTTITTSRGWWKNTREAPDVSAIAKKHWTAYNGKSG
nr:hypothetical protein BaRGS_009823 [Batillaria attramentaria]